MLEDRINKDLKQAMLAGDSFTTNSIRTLKSAILYAKVAAGTRDEAMSDSDVVAILQKEAKKRQESAELYQQGGNAERAEQELAEKKLIGRYLPEMLSEAQVAELVASTIAGMGGKSQASLGPVIQKVKEQSSGKADGALIARLAKESLLP